MRGMGKEHSLTGELAVAHELVNADLEDLAGLEESVSRSGLLLRELPRVLGLRGCQERPVHSTGSRGQGLVLSRHPR